MALQSWSKRWRYDGRIELLRFSASTVLKTAPRATAAHHSEENVRVSGAWRARTPPRCLGFGTLVSFLY